MARVSGRLDRVVVGGSVLVGGEVRRTDIGIAAGRIAAIAEDLSGEADGQIDARGLHVLPGAIDAHVHIDDPGRAEWEGFATGSAALAAGGATAFIDMPLNSIPATTDGAGLAAKREAAEGSSYVDFALWGGIVPGNLGELDELAAGGVVGFKAFMCDSGVDEFPACDEETLGEGMRCAARLGLPVAVHAESEAMTAEMIAAARAAGLADAAAFLASRPVAAELCAIETALELARETGCALHVVHVSCGDGMALIVAARERGVDVSFETCPHYLVFTEDELERLGAVAKCAPPLRAREDQEALWRGIADGSLPMVASDHSPCPPEMKAGDMLSAWGGIAGAQTTLPLLLAEGVHRRGLSLTRLAEVSAGFPAARFGLVGKGRIEVGADADLALVALDEEYVLAAADLQTRHQVGPYLGRSFRGRVRRTVLRGETCAVDGLPSAPPTGRLLRPNFEPNQPTRGVK